MNDRVYYCPNPACDAAHHVDTEAVEWGEFNEATIHCVVCDSDFEIAKPVSVSFGGRDHRCGGTGVEPVLISNNPAATIAAQAAEIETMKSVIGRISPENTTLRVKCEKQAAEVERLARAYADHGDTIAAQSATITGLRTTERDLMRERNALRLEVQKLKDDRHEAADMYAAIEAERDELREKVRILEATDFLLRTTYEADRARAESYLRVILAKDAEIAALGQAWKASMASGEAMQAAGLRFRHVSTEIPPFAAEEGHRE